MNGRLSISIESGDYIDADNALRVTEAEALPMPTDDKVRRILLARRLLGFSMAPSHLYSDWNGNFPPPTTVAIPQH